MPAESDDPLDLDPLSPTEEAIPEHEDDADERAGDSESKEGSPGPPGTSETTGNV